MGTVAKGGFSLDTLEIGKGLQITTHVIVQVTLSKINPPGWFRLTLTNGP